MKNKDIKQAIKMRVVRSWLPEKQIFQYYKLFSDGTFEESDRRSAKQYEQAYEIKVKTIVGKPEAGAWSTTGS